MVTRSAASFASIQPFKNNQWSARVGDRYRAVGRFVDGNTFVWTWIGSHEDYNKLRVVLPLMIWSINA